MGPAVAEMEIEETKSEPFLFFAADKTAPGAHDLPLFLAFADVMNTPGLMLVPAMAEGFRLTIMDVPHTEGDRVIDLVAPEELYDIAALLRDKERFVAESIHCHAGGEQAAVVSTSRLHNIAGRYTGKDDPVMLMRCPSPRRAGPRARRHRTLRGPAGCAPPAPPPTCRGVAVKERFDDYRAGGLARRFGSGREACTRSRATPVARGSTRRCLRVPRQQHHPGPRRHQRTRRGSAIL